MQAMDAHGATSSALQSAGGATSSALHSAGPKRRNSSPRSPLATHVVTAERGHTACTDDGTLHPEPLRQVLHFEPDAHSTGVHRRLSVGDVGINPTPKSAPVISPLCKTADVAVPQRATKDKSESPPLPLAVTHARHTRGHRRSLSAPLFLKQLAPVSEATSTAEEEAEGSTDAHNKVGVAPCLLACMSTVARHRACIQCSCMCEEHMGEGLCIKTP
eukprot:m.687621 g.687621  ORF g.687621 m.687621 type:complete len:217 (+) comp22844_c1_seq16:494-1144(+)